MAEEQQGVTITLREIYDSQTEQLKGINQLGEQMIALEGKIGVASEADERSRKALDVAEDAAEDAKEALEKIEQNEQEKKQLNQKIYVGILTALIPYVFAAVLGLIYIAKQGGF